MYRHPLAWLFVSVFSCFYSISFAKAQTDDDYKAEIMQHIVDPCFQYSASKQDPPAGMSESEMVELMKIMSPQAVQDTIDVTLPVVKGKPVDDRMKVYEIGLKLCIQGTGK